MKHPTDGTLRRLIDEPAGVPDAERAHVAGCPVCRGSLAAAQEAATATAAALRTEVSPDVDRAWRQLSARAVAADRGPAPATAPPRRGRAGRRRPARAGGGGGPPP